MKTILKHLAIFLAIVMVGFSSCSKDDELGKDSKSVFLKISNAPATYAEGNSQDAGSVNFASGDLYFTNDAGVILKHYTISSAASSETNINIGTLTSTGEAIQNLTSDVSAVYVTGNTSGLPATGNISAVKATTLQVISQGSLSSVNLYGETTTLTPESDNQYTCAVTLAPTVARIELPDIKAGGTITGFEVEGIFVDNYYSQATVSGTLALANLKNNGADDAIFSDDTTEYPNSLNPSIYDWYASPMEAASNIAKLESPKVWGYNIFAASAGSEVPRIIIRLKNITTSGSTTFADPQFITIKGIKSEGTSLASIKAGEIYKIESETLVFTEENVTVVPNLNTIDVAVSITVASWNVVNVTPEI